MKPPEADIVDNEEIQLEGGNLSTVVRVGDTVRRPSGLWTAAVHALLAHLEHAEFDAAPRARGLDDRNREVLSFIPGETAGAQHPWPAWVWSEETLPMESLGTLPVSSF